ncbi:uncharacterized protein LOC127728680 [Mytilus californianus]|uniref:uncharacterized protein LOC127728680 n=1 Tax=Mytilus californianus TaxID=6549 RepID=UPI0022464F7F|nr:uncharacterized protein LOC127728680 [Mytilus californianus]
MDPNQQNSAQGIQHNVPGLPDIGYQFPRIPQMQNILGPPMNTFVPGYNVMPQGQGTVMTNIQSGIPVSGFLSLGNSNASAPLPSMGSFIANLNQQSQVGLVQNVNKGGMENWTGTHQNNNTLPSFGHFLLPQQYQQQPTNQQALIGTSSQIIPGNQTSPQQQVFSPSQHSPQFFQTQQQSPQQQMFTTNQNSPQQVFINNQPSAQFFTHPQHSQQFFNQAIQQQQVFSGQAPSHQLFTNMTNTQQTPQQMFSTCQIPNRLPSGHVIGQEVMPQVMAAPRMNLNTNYIAGVSNVLGVPANQMLPPINHIMTSSGSQILPSVANVLQGQTLPSFSHLVSPYGGQNSTSGQMFLPTSISTSPVTTSVMTTMSNQSHLINIYGDQKVLNPDKSVSQDPLVVHCCTEVTITTPTITTTVSRTDLTPVTLQISPSVSNVSKDRSKLLEDSRTVVVPFGWSRVVVDNSIIYYSPSNVPLKSPMDLAKYLTTEGTCKCGLECPVLINKVFNFDVGILSRMWTLDIDCPKDLTKLCNHKRKMIAMAAFHTNYSISSSQFSDTVSVNSLSGNISSTTVSKTKSDQKKKTKSKIGKPVPYDGVLVSQLIAERDKIKQTDTRISDLVYIPHSLAENKVHSEISNNTNTSIPEKPHYNHLHSVSQGNQPLSSVTNFVPVTSQLNDNIPQNLLKNVQTATSISIEAHDNDNLQTSISDNVRLVVTPLSEANVEFYNNTSEINSSQETLIDKKPDTLLSGDENVKSNSMLKISTHRESPQSIRVDSTVMDVTENRSGDNEISSSLEENVISKKNETGELLSPEHDVLSKIDKDTSCIACIDEKMEIDESLTDEMLKNKDDENQVKPSSSTCSSVSTANQSNKTIVPNNQTDISASEEAATDIENDHTILENEIKCTINSTTSAETKKKMEALVITDEIYVTTTSQSTAVISKSDSKFSSNTSSNRDLPKKSTFLPTEKTACIIRTLSSVTNDSQTTLSTLTNESPTISKNNNIAQPSSSLGILKDTYITATEALINTVASNTQTTNVTSSVQQTTKTEGKPDSRDLRISVPSTIVTSILSSINAVKGHETAEKKQISPRSTQKPASKQQKGGSTNYGGTASSRKSPKPPASYDSFSMYQLRYPMMHGVFPPVSNSQVNPFGLNPFTGQLMTPGMFNFPSYPMMNDAWMDPKIPIRKKSPKTNKKEKVKKKVNCVYDSDTPPPNVDVSQLQDHGKGPIPKVSTSASFMDDPSAFLAEQTVLISSSLTSNLSSPAKKSKNPSKKDDKNDTVDGDVKTATVSSSKVSNITKTTTSMSVSTPFTLSSASHGMVVTNSTSLSKVGSAFKNKHWGLPIPISESHSILECNESDMFTEDRCESLSPDSGNEGLSMNETITPSSVVHHTATKLSKEKTPESHSDKNTIQNNKILDILSNAKKGFPPVGPIVKKISPKKTVTSVTSSSMTQPAVKSFSNRSAIQQVLSSAKSNEFPASTLLSAAARAQMAQQTMNFPIIPSVTQTQLPYVSQVKTSIAMGNNVSLVSADGSTFLATQSNTETLNSAKLQGSNPKSDIVSGHESVAKLLRQPINLNRNTLKGIDTIISKPQTSEKSLNSSVLATTVLNLNSKTVDSVPGVSVNSVTIPNSVPSNISNSLPHILPNLSGLPQNLGQPLMNIIGNNLGMNLLPNGQVVLPEQNGITIPQNNVQCIPLQNDHQTHAFVNMDNTSQSIHGIMTGANTIGSLSNKSTTQVLPLESQPNLVKPTEMPNITKMSVNYGDQLLQQQNIQSTNGQMVLMPNLHMPLMQYLGANSLPVNMNLDKTAIPQLCNMPDLQMLNGQVQIGLSQVGAPLNVMNVQQQVWNNLNTGNLTAMQIQTLQLQQQLLQQIQQLQDMQSLISQFSLQGNSLPVTTSASRDISMTTKENPITGKDTPETMVSIVSTTCQESPGNDEDGSGNSEDKGTCTDFDEGDDDSNYLNSIEEDREDYNGDVADTTCGQSSPMERDEDEEDIQVENLYDTHTSEIETDSENSGAFHGLRNTLSGASSNCSTAENLTENVSMCHTNYTSEPVNLVYIKKQDSLCANVCTSSSGVVDSSVMSSKTQSKYRISTQSSIKKYSSEQPLYSTETLLDVSVPSCIENTSISNSPVNLSCQTRNMGKDVDQNVISLQPSENEAINMSQKRSFEEEEIDVTDDTFESASPVKGLHDFSIGDLVWGQIRGFPSWPGKVVHESEVYEAEELEPGKCWVKWFGDHTFTQVEMLKLKTLTEGLEGHQKSKKKNKKGRKMNSNLEAAIHEALIELDRQTTLQMEMKIKPKGKITKKKKVK